MHVHPRRGAIVATQIEIFQARQSALLGLQLAIGELQEHAGADRRITTTAELLDGNQMIHNPRWTGVWKNQGPASAVSGTTDYQPQLLSWLVSGNEAVVVPAGGSGRIDIKVAAEWQQNWRLALSTSRNLRTDESYLFFFKANEQGSRISLRIIDLPVLE